MQWQRIASFVTHNHAQYSLHNDRNHDAQLEFKALRLDEYFSVFVGGMYPRLIIKNTASLPICLNLTNLELMGMASFHTPKCERGFIYLVNNVCYLLIRDPCAHLSNENSNWY